MITQYFRAEIAREILGSEQHRYSKFEEPSRACLQGFPLLTEHSILFNSFFMLIGFLCWTLYIEGKRMPLYGWTIATFYKRNSALLFFNSRSHGDHILYFESCKFQWDPWFFRYSFKQIDTFSTVGGLETVCHGYKMSITSAIALTKG